MIRKRNVIAIGLALIALAVTSLGCDTGRKMGESGVVLPVAMWAEPLDVDEIRKAAADAVDSKLPGAFPVGMIIKSPCADLATIHGELIFVFRQVKWGLPSRKVTMATVTVDTAQHSARIELLDESSFYPVLERQDFPSNREVRRVASLAQKYIGALSILSPCRATLTYLGNKWVVICGSQGPLYADGCQFEIIDGEIVHEQSVEAR